MAATTGQNTIDFGAGGSRKQYTSASVVGQSGIASGSKVEAWLRLEATANHTIDDMTEMDPIRVYAGTIIPGTGFTIYGYSDDKLLRNGLYIIDWVWV